ncbi:MAG: HAMP domain-containing sensor histidine kinase, partial [Thiopseudomonas sp.]
QVPYRIAMPDRLLAIAIRNLLENALKYAPDGPVVLRLSVDDAGLHIAVVDQGAGLDAEQFAAAQKRFWRARASADGSGLGLSIVSAICQRYQGELGCSRGDEGFVVWVRFLV